MNEKLSKITKTAAVGIFFMALLLNVKVSLTDPFVTISNDAVAQSSSNPFHVVYEWCVPQGIYIIKCRYEGGETCYANWQNPCF